MLTTYPDFTHPDAGHRQKELALAEQSVALAAELGAQLIRVTAGQARPETSRSDGIRWAVEGLTRLAQFAGNSAVTLVYENHAKPGVWDLTDFSTSPDIFLQIFHATANLPLSINFDTANATAYAFDPVTLLREVIGRVVSVHAADTAVVGELRPVLLGTGVTPFAALFGVLRQSGWDNWICIEEASFQGRVGVTQAIEFVRQAWAVPVQQPGGQ